MAILINNQALKEIDLKKIEHYVSGVADNNEKAWVESMFLSGEDNETLRHFLEKDWNLSMRDSSAVDVDLSHLLDRVHHLIRIGEQKKKQTIFHRFMKTYSKIAAILLVPLMVAGGLLYGYLTSQEKKLPDQQVSTTIYAPMGSRVSFNLPDGTTGMLNSGSHISYSVPFSSNRQIDMVGEGWFEVTKDDKHPFEINTGNSTITVLGTSFNLSAYPSENYVEVVLRDGQVEFHDNTSNIKVKMDPSERLVLRNGKISRVVTDPSKYSAWTKGRMIFNNDPMAEVARRIERWYNVTVILADKELEKYSFRGTFEDDKLDEVFRLLALTSPIKYKITPRKLLPDGTFEKEKVTIYLKKRV